MPTIFLPQPLEYKLNHEPSQLESVRWHTRFNGEPFYQSTSTPLLPNLPNLPSLSDGERHLNSPGVSVKTTDMDLWTEYEKNLANELPENMSAKRMAEDIDTKILNSLVTEAQLATNVKYTFDKIPFQHHVTSDAKSATFTISGDITPSSFLLQLSNDTSIEIKPDGSLTTKGDVNMNEAAKDFWKHVANYAPKNTQYVSSLEEDIIELKAKLSNYETEKTVEKPIKTSLTIPTGNHQLLMENPESYMRDKKLSDKETGEPMVSFLREKQNEERFDDAMKLIEK